MRLKDRRASPFPAASCANTITLLAGLVIPLLCGEALAAETATPSCPAVVSSMAEARTDGRLSEVVSLYGQAQAAVNCEPKTLFCLGRSVALAHVEAAYGAAAQGRGADSVRLLRAGRRFGAPWLLLVALGDANSSAARANHDPKSWSAASLDYQTGLAAIQEPSLCPDEPPVPTSAAIAQVDRKMTLASLLARPLRLFKDRCTSCGMAVLLRSGGSSDQARILPITFKDRGAALTRDAQTTVRKLVDCARAFDWTKLDVSVHTDGRGNRTANRLLASRQAVTLERSLRQDGFAGALRSEVVGQDRPLPIDDKADLTAAEINRANQRIELRAASIKPVSVCAVSRSDRQ